MASLREKSRHVLSIIRRRLCISSIYILTIFNILLVIICLTIPRKIKINCWEYSKVIDDTEVDPLYLVKASKEGIQNCKGLRITRPFGYKSTIHTNRLTNLVMTLHARQLGSLIENLKSWDKDYPPCHHAGDLDDPPGFYIGLTFYLCGKKNPNVEKTLVEAFNSLPDSSRQCFSHVSIEWATLRRHLDNHLDGSRIMFENIISGNVNLAGTPGYTMVMEPDCIPIRPYWLSVLDAGCRFPNEPFWVKGSLFRGDEFIMANHKLPMRYHINGNAIYNLGDPSFKNFYFNINIPKRTGAYDLDIWTFVADENNYNYIRHIRHLFQYTDMIQNIHYSRWNTNEVRRNSPVTVLVHGGRNVNIDESHNP